MAEDVILPEGTTSFNVVGMINYERQWFDLIYVLGWALHEYWTPEAHEISFGGNVNNRILTLFIYQDSLPAISYPYPQTNIRNIFANIDVIAKNKYGDPINENFRVGDYY